MSQEKISLNEKKIAIKNELQASRQETLDFMDSLKEEDLNKPYGDRQDSWTIFEVLKHIFSAEDGMTKLMAGIRDGGKGVPEDFDLERYNRSRVAKLSGINTLSELKELLAKSRSSLLRFLYKLTTEDFKKSGRHAIGKTFTIEQIFSICFNHELDHIKKLKITLITNFIIE